MPMNMQHWVFHTSQVRDQELAAAASLSVSAAQLMQRAAQSCLAALERQQRPPARVMILCGPGNNGGDGWVLARLATAAGYRVQVVACEPQTDLAKQAAQAWREQHGSVELLEVLDRSHLAEQDVIVDALLGTGLSRPLDELYQRVVETLNDTKHVHKLWVLSVDCPTGLQSDTGVAMPVAVEADYTVTMVALKPGLLTGQAAHYIGQLELAELGIASAFRQLEKPVATLVEQEEVEHCLPPRSRSSHKGQHGHVVIVGGNVGMSGAAILAGRAALRAGSGKVSVLTHPQSQQIVAMAQPELMVQSTAAEDPQWLCDYLQRADCVVLGPGLGSDKWSQRLAHAVLGSGLPVVVDADGLNLLSAHDDWWPSHQQVWLTPHPGEAARLLGISVAEVEADRWQALQKLTMKSQAHVVLKGAGSLIAHAESARIRVCRRGSPALAVGGSGDVLSGIVGSLVGQKLAPETVLPCAVWLHAVAAEHAAKHGERGTLPSDLLEPLRKLVNP